MAEKADVGLALWDGQSTGTLVNVARLVVRSEPAVVYVASTKTVSRLKTPDDLATLLSSADADVARAPRSTSTITSLSSRSLTCSDAARTAAA